VNDRLFTLPGVLLTLVIVIDERRPHAPAPGSIVICGARAAPGGAKTASSRRLIACSKAQAQTRERALAADKGTSAQYLKVSPAGARHNATESRATLTAHPFSKCQAAATPACACFFGDRVARCATLCACLGSAPGFTMTSINSFWAST